MPCASPSRARDTAQKGTETSLIERFLYPKLGPGQMWERVAARVVAAGGEVHLRHRVVGIHRAGERVVAVDVRDETPARCAASPAITSSRPCRSRSWHRCCNREDPQVLRIACALPYRDFMTAGLLMRRMRGGHRDSAANGMPPDNWIYVQEPDVKLGRLQVFNNWSPALVADPATIWLGLEYFCAEGDALWSMARRRLPEIRQRRNWTRSA